MYRSSRYAFASLALVAAFGLAQAQTKPSEPTLAAPPIPVLSAPPSKLPEEVKANDTPRMVRLRCSIVKIDEAFFSRPEAAAWADLAPKAGEVPWKIISDDAAQRFRRALRAGGTGFLLGEPVMTTGNGMEACYCRHGEVATLTGVSFSERDGATVPEFHDTQVNSGVECKFVPTLSADGKSCQVQMEIDTKTIDAKRPTPCEVTVKIPATDTKPESTQTKSVQVVGFISQRSINSTQIIPAGRCLLMYLSVKTSDNCDEHLAVMVTPLEATAAGESLVPVRADQPVAAPVKLPTKIQPCEGSGNCLYPYPVALLDERLAQYHKACAEQRWGDARKHAAACVELNPKCFLPK
jgi:hypothetical protein